MPNVHLRSPSRHMAYPMSHYASLGSGLDNLPPLPAHGPGTPSASAQGAFTTGYSPSRGSAYGGGSASVTPVTPSKKRVLNYSSPSTKTHRSSPSRNLVSPGQFNLGYGNGTNVGVGIDDMLSDKYNQSPIGRESQRALLSPRKPTRWVSKTPFKVLDAPELAVSRFRSCSTNKLIVCCYRMISISISYPGRKPIFWLLGFRHVSIFGRQRPLRSPDLRIFLSRMGETRMTVTV
jgi:hypothetical protein